MSSPSGVQASVERHLRPLFFKAIAHILVLVTSLPLSSLPGWDEWQSCWHRNEYNGKEWIPVGRNGSPVGGTASSVGRARSAEVLLYNASVVSWWCFSPESRDWCLPFVELSKAPQSPIHLSPVTVIKFDLQWGEIAFLGLQDIKKPL